MTMTIIKENQTDSKYMPYACIPEKSRGRCHKEAESKNRTCFQRDRDRIIHSSAFRRLEYKTQVFVNHEGDHYRTRLTHTLEVAQIARVVGRALRLDEDLAEALALAHDLGHPPFGHAGEEALNACMKDYGGFSHNAQSLKLLTVLEQKYAEFDGLNLTWETLEGVAKHNGPVVAKDGDPIPPFISKFTKECDLELGTYASAEAQVASLTDDIAYTNHDIDDGLRAKLFTINDLKIVPLVGSTFAEVTSRYPDLPTARLVHESIRRLIDYMVSDMITETRRNVEKYNIRSVDDVRNLGKPLVTFSETMQRTNRALKTFLTENMYRHYKVNRMTSKAKRLIKDLFELFFNEPGCLPTEWRIQAEGKDPMTRAEIVGDYIAGMTDRYAIDEHARLFDLDRKG